MKGFALSLSLSFWAFGTAALGLVFSMGLVVAYANASYVPWALMGGGIFGVAVGLGALGWSRLPSGRTSWRALSLLTLLGWIVIRLLFPLFPGPSSLALLGLMEAFAALTLGRLRGVIEECGLEKKPYLRLAAIAGGLTGAALALLFSLTLFFWAGGIALLVGWALTYLPAPVPSAFPGLKQQFGGWVRMIEAGPFLKWLVLAICLAQLLRAALIAETLSVYAVLLTGSPSEILLFFALLLAGSGLIGGAAFLLFALVRRRVGALVANLIYPVANFSLLLAWAFVPGNLVGPILGSVSYLALLPALFLREIRSNLSLFPHGFSRALGSLYFALIPSLGLLGGGFLWLVANALLPPPARLIFLLVLSAGLVGASVGVGLFYRKAWLTQAPVLTFLPAELPKLPVAQIRQLLGGPDPFLQELALKSAARHRTDLLPSDIAPVLALSLPKSVRIASYQYLGAKEGRLEALLSSEEPAIRVGAEIAALRHGLKITPSALTRLLGDENPAVRAVGCALGWQRGLGELATQVWEGLPLHNVPSEVLIELIEALQAPVPDLLIRVVKKLAWYPSPAVRQSAASKLADLLVGDEEDPNLLEVALAGIGSESADVRRDALRLLAATGADNASVHAAAHLTDRDPAVREAAAKTLAALGKGELALPALQSPNPEVVETAIRALAYGNDEKRLQEFLKASMPLIPSFRRLGEAAPVNVAIANSQQRVIRWTAVALEAGGEGEAAQLLQRPVRSPDSLDLLYRLVPKPFVEPLASLLRPPERERRSDQQAQEDLQTLTRASDPYLRVGAQITLQQANAQEEHTMNRLLFLKGTPYFQGLLLEELALLDARLDQREYLQGEVIFEEGSVGDRLYLIYQGAIALFHQNQALAELGVGEAFGEMALFEEEPRSATAKAATDTVLLALDQAHFHELIQQRPAILLTICRQLSQRLREMDKRFALVSS